MKKRLLTLGAIVMYLSLNAQQTVTYIGNNAKLYVSGGALVYSGGKWKVDSEMEKSVENRGDIIINGRYEKGNGTHGEDGREFVNIYIGEKSYGQVKILAQDTPSARMTIEKPAASRAYFDGSYPIGIPFIDDVKYIMKSFGKQESEFKGDCEVDVNCGNNRYKMTLHKWNNNRIHYDAVYKDGIVFQHGHFYAINLRENDMKAVMNGTISYKGTPSGRDYYQRVKGVISEFANNEAGFSNLGYNAWKKKVNPYNEFYTSYLGDANTESKIYNKNIYRFANPYTSNLDLSAFDGNDAWLRIKNKGGNNSIKQAYDQKQIRKFSVRKTAADYDMNWNKNTGAATVSGKNNYHIAEFDGQKWVGSAEALLIRPMETFILYFPALNATNLGGTRILDVEVSFNNNHKTFAHRAGIPATNSSMHDNPTRLSALSTMSSNDNVVLSEDLGITKSTFNQLEMFLVKDSKVQDTPAYIVGRDSYKESGSASINTNSIYAYGVKDDNVSYESKKNINEFNISTYIAKPLGIGFNNLTEGEAYELRFNLYEESIFNKVNNLTEGVFFLKDNLLDKVVSIDANTTYAFTADENVNQRFVVYWKELPKSTNIVDVVDTPTKISHKTIVYKDNNLNKVRFEGNKETAKIEVYNAAGRLILSKEGLSVDTDYTLNLNAKGMYVIKVTYRNQETRLLKFINN